MRIKVVAVTIESQTASRSLLDDLPPDNVLFGPSEFMQEQKRRLARISVTTVSVLLQGEVGVGKAVLSRFIHNHSAGVFGPYVSIHCGALSALSACEDPFACLKHDFAAPRVGTLFLGDVSELKPELQQQLSYALADFEQGNRSDRQDGHGRTRIICASTRDLHSEVRLGRFRRELFHRLAVVTIDVPPLRKRPEDLLVISEYLRLRFTGQTGEEGKPFPRDLLARMQAYDWPGNIRELENFVRQYVVLGCDRCTFDERSAAPGCAARCAFDDFSDPPGCKIERNWEN